MANESITKDKLIVCEGKDEINFLTAFLKNIGSLDGYQVWDISGVDSLKNKLKVIKSLPNYDKLNTLLLILDSDDNFDSRLQSVKDILKSLDLPYPDSAGSYKTGENIKVGVFLMPGNLENGMLEDLCLKTVTEHPAMSCLEAYMACLETNLAKKNLDEPKDPKKYYFPKNVSKAKALAFLAALHEPFNSVGIAALNGYWDFDHASLDDLKRFLQNS